MLTMFCFHVLFKGHFTSFHKAVTQRARGLHLFGNINLLRQIPEDTSNFLQLLLLQFQRLREGYLELEKK